MAFHYHLEESLSKKSLLLRWKQGKQVAAWARLLSLLIHNNSPKGNLPDFVKHNQNAKK